MTEEILVAIITGGVTLLGVLASNNKHDAVTDTKLDALTEEVKKHNNFAERIPVIENDIDNIYRRVGNIENKL